MIDADEQDYDADHRFDVVLQMFHPVMPPQMVTKALGLEPKRSWRVGEERKTPAGVALEGTYRETAWSISERFERRRDFFAACLEFVSRVLEPNAAFLSHFVNSGGRINLNVHLAGDTNIGDVLAPEGLVQLAQFGIKLSLEVFPDMN